MRDNILSTIAYYDVLDYPLRAREILRYLVSFERFTETEEEKSEMDLPTLVGELNAIVQGGILEHREDYYYLAGREHLVPLRKAREILAEKKMKKARRAVYWLAKLPNISAIFASGSLALGNTNERSDLDIFIVTKAGRIWTARTMVLFILTILGIRRRPKHIVATDLICANHFITDESLRIPFESSYTANLYANLVPLFVESDYIVGNLKIKNSWLNKYLLAWETDDSHLLRKGKSLFAKTYTVLVDSIIGNILERTLRGYQIRRIEKGGNATKDGRITYTDEQLEFHPMSPERNIIPRYNEVLRSLGLYKYAKEKDSGLTK